MAVGLNQDTLPFDKILQTGSELTGHFATTINCERCITTKRMTSILSQITSRLVCFYEAAYLNAATNLTSTTRTHSTSEEGCLPTPPLSQHGQMSPFQSLQMPRTPGCQVVSCEMKLGELCIDGSEAQILVEVVLVDACLDLNEKLQEWKAVMDELLDLAEEDLAQYDAIISRCLDRLAKLTGLLRLDGLSAERL